MYIFLQIWSEIKPNVLVIRKFCSFVDLVGIFVPKDFPLVKDGYPCQRGTRFKDRWKICYDSSSLT